MESIFIRDTFLLLLKNYLQPESEYTSCFTSAVSLTTLFLQNFPAPS